MQRFIQWIEVFTFCTTEAMFYQRKDFTYNKINTVLYFTVVTVIFCTNVFPGGGGGRMGGGWVYFLQLYVDLDGNHKNFKNHQNKKPQGKV